MYGLNKDLILGTWSTQETTLSEDGLGDDKKKGNEIRSKISYKEEVQRLVWYKKPVIRVQEVEQIKNSYCEL